VAWLLGSLATGDFLQQSIAEAPRLRMMLNARDQRRRAVGAPLADRNLSAPVPVPASGVPTSADRCIA
jgi:hypothetical protein